MKPLSMPTHQFGGGMQHSSPALPPQPRPAITPEMIRQHELEMLQHKHEEEVVKSMISNDQVQTTEPAPVQQVATVVQAVAPLTQTASFADMYQETLEGAAPIVADGYGSTKIG